MTHASMNVELEEDLGYSKYDYRNKQMENSLNGTYKKIVYICQGEIELEVSPPTETVNMSRRLSKSTKWILSPSSRKSVS